MRFFAAMLFIALSAPRAVAADKASIVLDKNDEVSFRVCVVDSYGRRRYIRPAKLTIGHERGYTEISLYDPDGKFGGLVFTRMLDLKARIVSTKFRLETTTTGGATMTFKFTNGKISGLNYMDNDSGYLFHGDGRPSDPPIYTCW